MCYIVSEDLAIPGVNFKSSLSVMSLEDKDQRGLQYRFHDRESGELLTNLRRV